MVCQLGTERVVGPRDRARIKEHTLERCRHSASTLGIGVGIEHSDYAIPFLADEMNRKNLLRSDVESAIHHRSFIRNDHGLWFASHHFDASGC